MYIYLFLSPLTCIWDWNGVFFSFFFSRNEQIICGDITAPPKMQNKGSFLSLKSKSIKLGKFFAYISTTGNLNFTLKKKTKKSKWETFQATRKNIFQNRSFYNLAKTYEIV